MKDWQNQLLKDLAKKHNLDQRIIKEIAHSPLKFTKRKIQDEWDQRPIRIRYFGVFIQKERIDKSIKRRRPLISVLLKNFTLMKLFDINRGKVSLIPQSLGIPEFKAIWDRDKSKAKERAYSEIAYITFMCDPTKDNPYRGYEASEREKVLKRDFLKDENFEVDELIQKAIVKFEDMLQTTNSRLLKAAKTAADKLSVYFENIDFDEKDDSGKPLYSAKDLSSNLSSVGSIVKSLTSLEDQVKKEQLESSRTRGGGEIGDYEEPREDFDYGQKSV